MKSIGQLLVIALLCKSIQLSRSSFGPVRSQTRSMTNGFKGQLLKDTSFHEIKNWKPIPPFSKTDSSIQNGLLFDITLLTLSSLIQAVHTANQKWLLSLFLDYGSQHLCIQMLPSQILIHWTLKIINRRDKHYTLRAQSLYARYQHAHTAWVNVSKGAVRYLQCWP